MGLLNLPKQYTYTDWVTVANIGATGTLETSSADIVLNISLLPYYSDLKIQWEYTIQTTGGTGQASGWLAYQYYDPLAFGARGALSALKYTPAVQSAATARTRKGMLNPIIAQAGSGTTANDIIKIKVEGKGSAADTEWAITDIKCRLVYLPL